MGNSPSKARLDWRIGVELGQVIAFAPAPAASRVERHFSGAGRSNGGEDVGAAASRTCRCPQLRITVSRTNTTKHHKTPSWPDTSEIAR